MENIILNVDADGIQVVGLRELFMIYVVQFGDGMHTCKHHHRSLDAALFCMQKRVKMANKIIEQNWIHSKIINKETGKPITYRKQSLTA